MRGSIKRRRGTDAQVLEDAERLIAAWNERQAATKLLSKDEAQRIAQTRSSYLHLRVLSYQYCALGFMP